MATCLDFNFNSGFTPAKTATVRELSIRDAFTTDYHFKQAGFVPLLKGCAALPRPHPEC
ncbi:MAG: hypothetical protein HY674_02160 [Chloroflexi bacterium]|nr:hypothetical protein [Chloroflexota bacterium]